MAENCSHDCSSCGENCSSRKSQNLKKAPHKLSKIRKVIAVVSGKGGVGKFKKKLDFPIFVFMGFSTMK